MNLTAKQLETALGCCPASIQRYRRAGRIKPAGVVLSDKGRPANTYRVVCPRLRAKMNGGQDAK